MPDLSVVECYRYCRHAGRFRWRLGGAGLECMQARDRAGGRFVVKGLTGAGRFHGRLPRRVLEPAAPVFLAATSDDPKSVQRVSACHARTDHVRIRPWLV
ncbi:hypothetical protein BCEP27_30923 [Burkholderia cepacia]